MKQQNKDQKFRKNNNRETEKKLNMTDDEESFVIESSQNMELEMEMGMDAETWMWKHDRKCKRRGCCIGLFFILFIVWELYFSLLFAPGEDDTRLVDDNLFWCLFWGGDVSHCIFNPGRIVYF